MRGLRRWSASRRLRFPDVQSLRVFIVHALSIHEGAGKDQTFNLVATAIYFTSTFAFDGLRQTKGYDYSRTANPTRAALEEYLVPMEGGARAAGADELLPI
ncbi:MAG: PLP-dependent transferase [Planctomycetota bacterium]